MSRKPELVTITPAILQVLQQCIEAGVVPSVAQGSRPSAENFWLVKFTILADGRIHECVVGVAVTARRLLDFICLQGPGFEGQPARTSIADCIALARSTLQEKAAHIA